MSRTVPGGKFQDVLVIPSSNGICNVGYSNKVSRLQQGVKVAIQDNYCKVDIHKLIFWLVGPKGRNLAVDGVSFNIKRMMPCKTDQSFIAQEEAPHTTNFMHVFLNVSFL